MNLVPQPVSCTRYASAARLLRPLHEQRPRGWSAPDWFLAASQYQGRRRTDDDLDLNCASQSAAPARHATKHQAPDHNEHESLRVVRR